MSSNSYISYPQNQKKNVKLFFFNMKSVTLLSPQAVTHFSAFPRNIDLALV